MHAFVSGSSGFIGRKLVDRLTEGGHICTGLTRRVVPSSPSHSRKKLVSGDIGAPAATLASLMRGCDVVFHLAALISFDTARRPDLMRINGDGTERMLEAARIARVPRVIVVSSACTVGMSHAPDAVLDEDEPLQARWAARNPYLASKQIAEQHAFSAADRGQHVVIVCPTTVYGAGDHSLNSGTLIRQVSGARFIPVPPGGSNVVSVDDVVQGIILAAERGQSGRRYILGGTNLTFAEIISSICTTIGRRPWCVPLVSAAQLPMMGAAWLIQCLTRSNILTPQIIADTFAYKFYSSARAANELGWKSQKSFTDSVWEAWRYYLNEGLISDVKGAAA